MEEQAQDSQDMSIPSGYNSRKAARSSDQRDGHECAFQIPEEVLNSRKTSWELFFQKYSQPVSDEEELNIRTMKPVGESGKSSESSESETEVRFPVRKTKAQIQYWVTTGRAPCQAVELESSYTDETMSISESETENFEDSEQFMMATNKKQLNSCEENLSSNQLSSASSVDTAAYIKNNANMTVKKNAENGRSFDPAFVENNRIIRSMNSAIPKVLLTRLENLPTKFNVNGKITNDVKISDKMSSLNDKNVVENRLSDQDDQGVKSNLKNTTAEDSEPKLACKDSEISYLPVTLKVSKENDNNDENSNAIVNDLNKTTSLDSKNILGDNISDKNNQGLQLNLENTNVKDSKVTLTSKESGFSSLALGDEDKLAETKNNKISSSVTSETLPFANTTLLNRRRKLYTGDDAILDVLSPSIETSCRFTFKKRLSIHPALATPTTSALKKKRNSYRPRFLIIPRNIAKRRKNQNEINKSYARDRRNRNKSDFSKSKLVEDSGIKRSDLINNIQVADKKSKNSEESKEKNETQIKMESSVQTKKKAASVANTSSSSLSSNDVSQIIREELNRSPEVRKMNVVGHSSAVKIQRCDNIDETPIFTSSGTSFSKTIDDRKQNMLNVKRNLYATDLRSSIDAESPKVSTSGSVDSKINENNCLSLGKRSINSLQDDERIPVVILHDFVDIKPCCTKLEREINKKWLQKQKKPKMELEENVGQSDKKPPSIDYKSDSNTSTKIQVSVKGTRKSNRRKTFVNSFNLGDTESDCSFPGIKNSDKTSDQTSTESGTNFSEVSSENRGNFPRKQKRYREKTEHIDSEYAKTLPKIRNGIKSQRLMKHKVLVKKRTISDTQKSIKNFNSNSINSEPPCSSIKNPGKNSNRIPITVGENSTNPTKESTGTLVDTIYNRRDSALIVTSSDDENLPKILTQPFRRRSQRQRSPKDENTLSSSVTESNTKLFGRRSQRRGRAKDENTLSNSPIESNTKSVSNRYVLVSSNSEDEKIGPTTVSSIGKSQKVKKKFRTRNTSKDYLESETTLSSVNEDENVKGAQNLKPQNKKLEKQSAGVNKLVEVKKSKRSLKAEDCKDSIITRSRLKTNSDDSVSSICSGNLNDALESNEKENSKNNLSQDLKRPVDQATGRGFKRVKSCAKQKNSAAKTAVESNEEPKMSVTTAWEEFHGKIQRMIKAVDSEDEDPDLDNSRTMNNNDKSRHTTTTRELCLTRIDESSEKDDTISSSILKNSAGNYSRDDKISKVISINEDNNKVHYNDDPTLRRRKNKRRRRRSTNSTVVYRTKEFWEMDSDHS